jgi:hypothetical protein
MLTKIIENKTVGGELKLNSTVKILIINQNQIFTFLPVSSRFLSHFEKCDFKTDQISGGAVKA